MDEAEEALPALKSFILPGGCPGAAELHVCRAVCRRAERTVVELFPSDAEVEPVLRYLNRLSDLLFVLARLENRRAGVDDVRWEKEDEKGEEEDDEQKDGAEDEEKKDGAEPGEGRDGQA